mgnify:CR=1 FL=1
MDILHQNYQNAMDAALAQYDSQCAKILQEAKARLANVSDDDADGVNAILVWQKNTLKEAYLFLKNELNHIKRKYFQEIEQYNTDLEQRVLADLDGMLLKA